MFPYKTLLSTTTEKRLRVKSALQINHIARSEVCVFFEVTIGG